MAWRLRSILAVPVILLALPVIILRNFMQRRDPREYGLTPADRDFEIARKMGASRLASAHAALARVQDPDDRVLGAIVFLSHSVESVEAMVDLANEDRPRLLNAATVKEERG